LSLLRKYAGGSLVLPYVGVGDAKLTDRFGDSMCMVSWTQVWSRVMLNKG